VQLIRRNQIDFGKIDAKSAMVTRDTKARSLFLQTFVFPPTVDMAAFSKGDRYLVYGTKGSGKTALLRYLMEKEKENGSATKIVVFTDDVSSQDKEKIASQIDFESVMTPDSEDQNDLRDMWKLYILKCICDIFHDNPHKCNDIGKILKIRELIYDVFDSGDRGILDKIRSKIRSGTFRFKFGSSDLAEFEGTLNYTDGDDKALSLNYTRFADTAFNAICAVDYPDDVKFCLYIDELNLSMLGQKQHKKDSLLIRDLILTIGNINRIFTEKSIPIYIYAAVRVEVAKAINVSRNEIDKYLLDHGQQMRWHNGLEIERYPLFKIIESRIAALEKKATGRENAPSEIWNSYFAGNIFGVSPKQFLSEITWCNPRDLVNLFNLAQTAQIHLQKYDTEVFNSVAHDYSERVWSERAEELNAEHSMTVVNAIRRLLTSAGFDHFKVDSLKTRADGLSGIDQVLTQVVNTVGIEKICRDLYHVGVIGQSLPLNARAAKETEARKKFNQTWFYRDNREFDPTSWLFVHPALYPAFKLPNWNARHFAKDPRLA